jgi:chorismate mutase
MKINMNNEINMNIDALSDWGIKFGEKLIISGPCSAESEEQVLKTAVELAKYDINILRAGIWKPRTRPKSFEGVGSSGLKWLKRATAAVNLPVVVEVATQRHVEKCLEYGIDMLWIGARTTVNPFAVQAIADALRGVDIPVLIKNPINPDVELWIGAIERINQAGISKIAAIHRGFSSFKKSEYRNKPNWEIPIELRRRIPNLPIICDPSHICGNRELLLSVSQTAMDLLFDGLIIESHIDPSCALSDAKQQLKPEALGDLLNKLKFKKKITEDANFHIQINRLREEIDEIDYQLIDILAKRMEIAKTIGQVKKKVKVSILQPDRWTHIVKNRIEAGKKQNLSEEFILEVFREIHQESIHNQRINNSA